MKIDQNIIESLKSYNSLELENYIDNLEIEYNPIRFGCLVLILGEFLRENDFENKLLTDKIIHLNNRCVQLYDLDIFTQDFEDKNMDNISTIYLFSMTLNLKKRNLPYIHFLNKIHLVHLVNYWRNQIENLTNDEFLIIVELFEHKKFYDLFIITNFLELLFERNKEEIIKIWKGKIKYSYSITEIEEFFDYYTKSKDGLKFLNIVFDKLTIEEQFKPIIQQVYITYLFNNKHEEEALYELNRILNDNLNISYLYLKINLKIHNEFVNSIKSSDILHNEQLDYLINKFEYIKSLTLPNKALFIEVMSGVFNLIMNMGFKKSHLRGNPRFIPLSFGKNLVHNLLNNIFLVFKNKVGLSNFIEYISDKEFKSILVAFSETYSFESFGDIDNILLSIFDLNDNTEVIDLIVKNPKQLQDLISKFLKKKEKLDYKKVEKFDEFLCNLLVENKSVNLDIVYSIIVFLRISKIPHVVIYKLISIIYLFNEIKKQTQSDFCAIQSNNLNYLEFVFQNYKIDEIIDFYNLSTIDRIKNREYGDNFSIEKNTFDFFSNFLTFNYNYCSEIHKSQISSIFFCRILDVKYNIKLKVSNSYKTELDLPWFFNSKYSTEQYNESTIFIFESALTQSIIRNILSYIYIIEIQEPQILKRIISQKINSNNRS